MRSWPWPAGPHAPALTPPTAPTAPLSGGLGRNPAWGAKPGGPGGGAPTLADAATLASLAALAPGALAAALPVQLRSLAAGGCGSGGGGGGSQGSAAGAAFSATMAAIARLVAAACDRGALLASGDLRAAVAATLAGSGVARRDDAAGSGWAAAAADWLERACAARCSSGEADLLCDGSGDAGAGLLARLRRLAAWEASEEYAALAVAGNPGAG